MSVMRTKIKTSAIRLFAEKGYQATSIQDIADDCSIAKGSIYKLFSSKEELYVEILEERHIRMLEGVEAIKQKPGLSAQELFVEEIQVQLEFLLEHGFLGSADHKKCTPDYELVGPTINRLRMSLLSYYKDMLRRRFGSTPATDHWDAAVLFNGLMREFMAHILLGTKPLSLQELARYLAERMKDLVGGFDTREDHVMLPNSMMQEYEEVEQATLYYSYSERQKRIYGEMMSLLSDLPIPNIRKQELLQVLTFVQAELAQGEPRFYLVYPLFKELATEETLRVYVKQLEQLIRIWRG